MAHTMVCPARALGLLLKEFHHKTNTFMVKYDLENVKSDICCKEIAIGYVLIILL